MTVVDTPMPEGEWHRQAFHHCGPSGGSCRVMAISEGKMKPAAGLGRPTAHRSSWPWSAHGAPLSLALVGPWRIPLPGLGRPTAHRSNWPWSAMAHPSSVDLQRLQSMGSRLASPAGSQGEEEEEALLRQRVEEHRSSDPAEPRRHCNW